MTKFLTPVHQQMIVKKIADLWNVMDMTVTVPLLEVFLAELVELSGFVVTELPNTHILLVS